MLKKLKLKSDLVKHILVLMSGTVLAQVLGYLFSPIITRIYTPEEAGELGFFIRVVGIGAAFATLRYELALPIIKTNAHSFRMYLVALKSTIIVSFLSIILFVLPVGVSPIDLGMTFYIMLPLAIFMLAYNNIGTNWAIRNKFFSSISYARISNSLVGSVVKIGLGWLNMGSSGLLIGMVIGSVVSNIKFFSDFIKAKKEHLISIKSPRNIVLAKSYSEFPKINLPHVLVDLGRDLLVAVLLLKFFSKEDFGLYDLSYRMLKVPLIFIGLAIGQVFFQNCAERVNKNEDIFPVILKAVKTLFLLSIVPFSVIFFFGEEIFSFVFGDKWIDAGRFAEIMSPWFMANFILSPISSIPIIIRRQSEFFKLSIVGTTIMIVSLIVSPLVFNLDIYKTLWVVSSGQAIYLFFAMFVIFYYTKKGVKEK